ncbi:hypothetical protein [Algoriphagus sp. NG3]|uniref:hypothetical protein n=1 Tax=Algoriphagus sp. NG3 TaxID=3097546 RepID=UPI002A83683C|nr:hypothetical protein [Algoriphagus sp. NG3]WPR73733.1 hypothetical protein SLW71_13700 [Algoriphagus sp. NG3]
MTLIKYEITDLAVVVQLGKLQRKTRDLALKLHLIINRIEVAKIKESTISLDLEKDYCGFYLFSLNRENLDFRIDLFDGFYDVFADEEEIVIQQKIIPIEKSLVFIENHLKSTVQKTYVNNEGGKSNRSQFDFYIGNEMINSIGNYGSFNFFSKNKKKEIMRFGPWIND